MLKKKFMLHFLLDQWTLQHISRLLDMCLRIQTILCVLLAMFLFAPWSIQPALTALISQIIALSLFTHKSRFLEFTYHNPAKQLRWKFMYRDSEDAKVQASIAAHKGVCMSVLDCLPTWNGALSILPKIMHMFWGPGVSGQIHKVILIEGSMFMGKGKQSEITLMDCLTKFVQSIWWPSNSGRFQLKIASGGERPKADEWRNFMCVYPVALAVAWNMWSCPPDADTPNPKKGSKVQQAGIKSKKLLCQWRIKNIAHDEDAEAEDYLVLEDITPSRNYHSHYENVLQFCTATHIFASCSVTPCEAQCAEEFISQASQSWAQMNCHLTPNLHSASHLLEYINTYGPAYAWWVFPYEQAIGLLGQANNNGHGSGEIKGTFMCSWWKSILVQELLMHLQFRPQSELTNEDEKAVLVLLQVVKGGAEVD
ncbi:hypothetical protein BDR05DRAFT_1005389 [Suillus weaverae]|nr:hypothetical protein BDR05DRAFT_1005389 [Suillus weaverae]